MLTITVLVLATALLLAMVFNLVLKPRFSATLTTACMITALAGGLLIYGTGYAQTTGDAALSILRTPFAVVRMFVGVNDLSGISGTTFVSTKAGILFFWFIHLCAFYSMASAAMFTLGAELLRHLQVFLSRKGKLVLIYGVHDGSVELGRDCLSSGGCSVIFAEESVSPEDAAKLNNLGMAVIVGTHVSQPDKALLRKLHLKKRKLAVYALSNAEDQNLIFAEKLLHALKDAGIPARQTAVTLPGEESIISPILQVTEDKYGYGFVQVVDEPELAARALIRICPPWEALSFDENGRAEEDYSCAVIGFGKHGQAVLKQLIMNGQFAGSRFHAAVFSPVWEEEAGAVFSESPEIFRQYDIQCFHADARSRLFYSWLEERLASLKLIAVCTGDEALNREITNDLMLFLKRRKSESISILECGKFGVRYQPAIGSQIERTSIYTQSLLSAEIADRNAMILNSTYDSSSRSVWEKWLNCDTFGRASSRASADFIPAMIRMSLSSRGQILSGNWNLSPELLETLGETEHLRWMAFHFVMGYSVMSPDKMEENARILAENQRAGIPCSTHITKDSDARLHACLVPWEELDALSQLETELTGRKVDYKQIDKNNVLTLPQILQAEKEAGV